MTREKGVDKNSDFELLKDLIGSETAMRVADVFGGSSIYIPKNDLISSKYNSIRRKYRAGATYRELSDEFKYSKGHIRNIIHGMRPKGSPTKTSVKGAKAT